MEGGSRSCSEVVTVKKKSKKFKLKKLLLRGLGTLISGMIFGVGCAIVDRIDNWSQAEDPLEKVTVNSYVSTKDRF
jgi:hypothetical protein